MKYDLCKKSRARFRNSKPFYNYPTKIHGFAKNGVLTFQFSKLLIFYILLIHISIMEILRGLGNLVEVSQNFWPLAEVFFSQKWVFLDFRDISTKTTSNITFYCTFIQNSPKIPKEVPKNFRHLRRCENPFFSDSPCMGEPPNITLISIVQRYFGGTPGCF